MENKWRQYAMLFRVNFFISAFTFGGGYVVVPMMRKYFVEDLKQFQEKELLDMAAVSQSTPGAIAVNIAALAGYRIGGISGAAVSVFAAVLPPFLILSAISVFYEAFRQQTVIAHILKGMEAGVAALMVDFILDLGQSIWKEKKPLLTILVPASFIASFLLYVNVMAILSASAAVCFLAGCMYSGRRGRHK